MAVEEIIIKHMEADVGENGFEIWNEWREEGQGTSGCVSVALHSLRHFEDKIHKTSRSISLISIIIIIQYYYFNIININ